MIPETVWGILPFGFLYDLYKAWFIQNSPSGKIQGRNTFVKEIADMAEAGKIPGFTTFGRKNAMRPKKLMDTPEPLILEYKLERWMSPTYPISDGHFLSKVAKNGFSGSNIPAHISGISKNNGTRVVGAIVLYI